VIITVIIIGVLILFMLTLILSAIINFKKDLIAALTLIYISIKGASSDINKAIR